MSKKKVKLLVSSEDLTTITNWVHTYTGGHSGQNAVGFIADALRNNMIDMKGVGNGTFKQ